MAKLSIPYFFAAVLLIGLLYGCSPAEVQSDKKTVIAPASAAVAMPDKFAADIAAEVLMAGGNAIDAAVAAAFSLAVTYPEAGNIGGGGFMVMYVNSEPLFLDYREAAPAAAYRDMYLDEQGNVIPDLSLVGHRSSGVPGTVAGLWAAHQRFGALPWRRLVQPAIRLAQAGFIAGPQVTERAAKSVADYAAVTNFEDYFGDLQVGEVFQQPALAVTLQRIADAGADGFYKGATAAAITEEMARGGGLITIKDLANYRPVWRDPLVADWRGSQIIASSPPSSGGFAVIALLKMKDYLADQFAGLAHNSIEYIHLVAEMEKRVYADRAEFLGDPDFFDFDIQRLINEDYLKRRAAEVNSKSISALTAAQPGLESHDTIHFSIIDFDGNAVSNTYTINGWFGSHVVIEGAGFLLNNEMDDFSVKPGVPNYYGVVGDTANAIEPGKRMLSSMSPTILVRDDQVEMVVGAQGGSTIITSVFQAIVNVSEFGMTADAAVEQSYFHHQLLPINLITYSPTRPLPTEVITAGQQQFGYSIVPHAWEFGDIQLITRDANGLQAASDSRGRGKSIVLEQGAK
ncbi:MAG: gamma-glutamyltranspeptidase/glutathione hydrolase [Bacteroidia bacterium]|jgi:gamma-glutamyltranspeptidase/glutathione hydrolase